MKRWRILDPWCSHTRRKDEFTATQNSAETTQSDERAFKGEVRRFRSGGRRRIEKGEVIEQEGQSERSFGIESLSRQQQSELYIANTSAHGEGNTVAGHVDETVTHFATSSHHREALQVDIVIEGTESCHQRRTR